MKCATPHCRRRRRKDRLVCARCHMRAWRRRDPVAAALATLRDHARARGVACELTLDWWRQWVVEAGLFVGGPEGLQRVPGMHVDRIDASEAYRPGNVRVLPAPDNIAKGNRERWAAGYALRRVEMAEAAMAMGGHPF